MISEVLNALCITYVATEYLVSTSSSSSSNKNVGVIDILKRIWKSKVNKIILFVILIINIIERYHITYNRVVTIADNGNNKIHNFVDKVLHIPKIIFAAISYIIVLYYDCKKIYPFLKIYPNFVVRLCKSFIRILPVYPFLAVIISFIFIPIISIWDTLHLSHSLLNGPIYYGCLYGPFSAIYWAVKKNVIQDYGYSSSSSSSSSLPTTTAISNDSSSSGATGGGGGGYRLGGG